MGISSRAGEIARIEYTASAEEKPAKNGAPTKRIRKVPRPMPARRAKESRKTRQASLWLSSAVFSETSLAIAVGMPAVEIASSRT